MLLADLVAVSRRVSELPGRLAKVQALADALRQAGSEAELAVLYLSGAVRPQRLGARGAALAKMLREDPPAPAVAAALTLTEVDTALHAIGAAAGARAVAGRGRLLRELFARATADEQDFLARLLIGALRQGAVEGVMLEAVACAAALDADRVRRAAMLSGDLPAVASAALSGGAPALDQFGITLFRPVRPMLAGSAADTAAALQELGEAAFEYKLDGARVQVHKCCADVRVYSRRLNDVTVAVPEIVNIARALPVQEAILDGEALAFRENGMPQPFQVSMRRFGRRLDVEARRASLPLRPFFFDCLRLEGEDLTLLPACERAAALVASVPAAHLVPRTVTAVPAIAAGFFEDSLRAGHEGVMAKALDGVYAAGARGGGWLKIKRATTLDLVVLAAEWGHGRRRGFLSNLHLGARDQETGGFVMLGKTFKGMTDAMLRWQTQRLSELALAHEGAVVHVRPELVVEVAFNDIQASRVYPGGLALRFARIKRYRPDKQPQDADSLSTVRALFARRAGSFA